MHSFTCKHLMSRNTVSLSLSQNKLLQGPFSSLTMTSQTHIITYLLKTFDINFTLLLIGTLNHHEIKIDPIYFVSAHYKSCGEQ